MKLTDLVHFPNVPVKTIDGIGIITGIPDYNTNTKIVRVKFGKIGPKPNALECGKLREYWDTVDYGYYVLNSQNQIILKEILHMTLRDAKVLGYDINIFPIELIKRNFYEKLIFNGFTADEFRTLCNLHFDIFRWIDKNLALSSTHFNFINT